MLDTTRLTDGLGRQITYLRLSVTDRCDLRCVYCMAERMVFLPKSEILSLGELVRLARAFIRRGVERIRITGGEPLVRRNLVEGLIAPLSRDLRDGALREITLTTNGTQLTRLAAELAQVGVRRINVSLDSLDPETYKRITRGGELARALDGIEAARDAGLAVKINTVALKQDNLAEIPDMIAWAHEHGLAITLIEVMPMGDTGHDRLDQYAPLTELRTRLEEQWHLIPLTTRTGGPARYVQVGETGGTLGFITPLTNNFCAGCNRVRVTCTGMLHTCLGHEHGEDLRAFMRASPGSDLRLDAAIDKALAVKPAGHDFRIGRRADLPAVARHMSVTGG